MSGIPDKKKRVVQNSNQLRYKTVLLRSLALIPIRLGHHAISDFDLGSSQNVPGF